MPKLYPFSAAKHAHDIEFRYNRTKNEIGDYFLGEFALSKAEFERLCDLEEELCELLEAVLWSSDGRVCWLTDKQYGLAKECVLWASCRRGG